MKNAPILLALLALLPLAHAHDPPAPQPLCVGPGEVHDVGPAHPPVQLWDHSPQYAEGPAHDGCAPRDGEPEFAFAYAVLFAETGDGVTSGVAACYGAGATGHHSTQVRAQEWPGGAGPAFEVIADHSRAGAPILTPDCGDDLLEPCNRPFPNGPDFPLNVIVEMVSPLLWDAACNPLDARITFEGAPAASGGSVPFPPGPDGAYHVVVFPVAGHVWTE